MDRPATQDNTDIMVARTIAGGADWRISEYVCRASPTDRPFEEKHGAFTIAAVVEGSFTYKTHNSRALLHPGALLLGNCGRCFECGHDHSRGDRCIAVDFSPEFFAEISASAAGTSRFGFPTAMLPAMKQLTPLVSGLESLTNNTAPMHVEETVAHLAETVLGTLTSAPASAIRVSTKDERRISDVLRYLEGHAAESISLDALAQVALMSKYHFLRTFRTLVGVPPYQFLIMMRMRRAAVSLARTGLPISTIAFDAGFGDLSTFNYCFREMFRVSPLAYRKSRTRKAP